MQRPRAYQRYDVDLLATATFGEVIRGAQFRNMSVGGALLQWGEDGDEVMVRVGDRFELGFEIPFEGGLLVQTWATVRWVSPGAVGIQFDGLRAKEAWALGKFLESLPSS